MTTIPVLTLLRHCTDDIVYVSSVKKMFVRTGTEYIEKHRFSMKEMTKWFGIKRYHLPEWVKSRRHRRIALTMDEVRTILNEIETKHTRNDQDQGVSQQSVGDGCLADAHQF